MPESGDDLREIDRLTSDVCRLVDELGVAGEIRGLDFELFLHRINEDGGEADRVLSRIKELRLLHEASSHLLGALLASMSMRNPALARAAFDGIQAFAEAKLGDDGADGGEG